MDSMVPQSSSQHAGKAEGSSATKHKEHLPKGVSQTEEERQQGWFIGSIDQGTTSSRFLIFDGNGNPVANHQIEFENMYPKSGYGHMYRRAILQLLIDRNY
jgi:glycerol kinase